MAEKPDIYEKNGWVYITPYVKHPKIEKYRSIGRFNKNPETIVSISNQIPKVKKLDKYDLYKKWCKAFEVSERIKRTEPENIKFDSDFKYDPMMHQRVALAFSLSLPASGLFMETGTGKTFVALMNAKIRKEKGKIGKILVIAPPSILHTVWYEECVKFTSLNPVVVHPNRRETWICPITKIKISRLTKKHLKSCGMTKEEYYEKWPDAEKIELNSIKKIDEILNLDRDLFITSPGILSTNCEEFLSAGFDMLILDESTMIKSPSAIRTKAVHKVGHTCKYRLILTGTPITNNLEDIWSQMYLLDQCLGPVFSRFIRRYFWTHPQHSFIRNPLNGAEREITNIISKRCIRFRKDECLDLPDQTFIVRDVPMTKNVERAYKSMHEDMFAMLDDGTEITVDMVITQAMKLQQIVNGFVIDEEERPKDLDKVPSKIKEVKGIIDGLHSDQKVVIWSIFKKDMDNLMDHLSDYNPVLIKSSNVNITEDKFKNDPSCRVAISHPKSCKYGHNWTHSNVTIYYSLGYSVEDYLQSLARNYRKGQEKKVTVFFITSGPIDNLILESIARNKSFGDSIVDDESIRSVREKLRV